jgi:hypothetical protein
VSPSHSWDRNTLPEALYVSDDGRTVLLPKGAIHRCEPTPRLSTEVVLWPRPSAALAFPFHPVGAAELVRRADELLEEAGAFIGLTDDEIALLGKQLWACAENLHAGGVAVRSAIDAFASSTGNYLPTLSAYEGAERAKVKGIALLAAWAVVHAACEWVGEVS